MLLAIKLGPWILVSGLDQLSLGGLLDKEEAARGGRSVTGLAATLGNVTLLAFELLLNGTENSLAVFTEAFAEWVFGGFGQLPVSLSR